MRTRTKIGIWRLSQLKPSFSGNTVIACTWSSRFWTVIPAPQRGFFTALHSISHEINITRNFIKRSCKYRTFGKTILWVENDDSIRYPSGGGGVLLFRFSRTKFRLLSPRLQNEYAISSTWWGDQDPPICVKNSRRLFLVTELAAHLFLLHPWSPEPFTSPLTPLPADMLSEGTDTKIHWRLKHVVVRTVSSA